MSPPLNCGDSCQIWTWYFIASGCFDNGEKYWYDGINFSDNLIGIQTSSLKKMHLKKLSGKWRPFYLSLNVLRLLELMFIASNKGYDNEGTLPIVVIGYLIAAVKLGTSFHLARCAAFSSLCKLTVSVLPGSCLLCIFLTHVTCVFCPLRCGCHSATRLCPHCETWCAFIGQICFHPSLNSWKCWHL